jgi:hypothetical protein
VVALAENVICRHEAEVIGEAFAELTIVVDDNGKLSAELSQMAQGAFKEPTYREKV